MTRNVQIQKLLSPRQSADFDQGSASVRPQKNPADQRPRTDESADRTSLSWTCWTRDTTACSTTFWYVNMLWIYREISATTWIDVQIHSISKAFRRFTKKCRTIKDWHKSTKKSITYNKSFLTVIFSNIRNSAPVSFFKRLFGTCYFVAFSTARRQWPPR